MVSKTEIEIRNIISEIREELVVERLDTRPEDQSVGNDVLYGQCVENAQRLAQELSEHLDSEVRVVHGGLDLPKEPTPSSYEEADRDGTVHHWVRVVDKNGMKYNCNVVREGEIIDGKPLVSKKIPESYIDFGRSVSMK